MDSEGAPEVKPEARNGQREWNFMNEFWFEVTFVYRCDHTASNKTEGQSSSPDQCEDQDVYLAGDFNHWSPSSHRMSRCPEGYSITLLLSEGFYHYKFLVGGHWLRDFHNPHVGGRFDNSIMFVHMDPGVYSLREQHPPHRDYHRSGADGGQFRVHCPPLPQDVAAAGILQRLVFVYLPPSYSADTERRYPVVYANDGQNVFSTPEHHGGPCRGGWYLDAKLDHFWGQGLLPEFILVAVPNSDFVCIGNRNREYCTSRFRDTSRDPYQRYLVEAVKQEIDECYRTLPTAKDTVILGASMGGLCAFTLAMNHPNIFSACVCMSPSFWYVDSENRSAFDLIRGGKLSDGPQDRCCCRRVYIDSGDGIGDNCYETRLMRELLAENGWKEGEELCYKLDQCCDRVDMGVTHLESVWRERVLPALQFALRHKQ